MSWLTLPAPNVMAHGGVVSLDLLVRLRRGHHGSFGGEPDWTAAGWRVLLRSVFSGRHHVLAEGVGVPAINRR